MMDLKLHILMNQKLRKIREISFDLTLIFDGLSLVIPMSDFHQFVLVQGKPLYGNQIEEKKMHRKSF